MNSSMILHRCIQLIQGRLCLLPVLYIHYTLINNGAGSIHLDLVGFPLSGEVCLQIACGMADRIFANYSTPSFTQCDVTAQSRVQRKSADDPM